MNNNMTRVVITGIGVISPIGIGKENFFKALEEGRNGIDRISKFDIARFSSQMAGEVRDFNPENYMDKKEAKRTVRFIQFAIATSKMALEDAGLTITEELAPQAGVLIGSGIGGIGFLEEQAYILRDKGPDRCSPFMVPWMICDMAAGMVSIHTGAKGPNSCVVTACATGTHSIGDAFEILKRGDARVMIAGSTEASITPLGVAGFCAARALSTRNDNPTRASRPFDKNRDGFVIGEGCGVVILETLEHALSRKAKIYGELIGYGMSGDAHHITAPAPAGEGAARAIRAALKDAKIEPKDVDYINAHGTSTELNDKFETMAVKKVYGEQAYKVKISSTKSMIGHLLGASGSVEFIATLLAVSRDIIHPTINYETPDPECDLNYVPNKSIKQPVNIALSHSFGFGGHNAILVVKKYKA